MGSDAGIESIGMSPQLVKKFQKGIAVSYDMIIQEINKNVKLKIDILELNRQLKREKRANNFQKVLKLQKLIRKNKISYHQSKIIRSKVRY